LPFQVLLYFKFLFFYFLQNKTAKRLHFLGSGQRLLAEGAFQTTGMLKLVGVGAFDNPKNTPNASQNLDLATFAMFELSTRRHMPAGACLPSTYARRCLPAVAICPQVLPARLYF